jgi:hypothetical protein
MCWHKTRALEEMFRAGKIPGPLDLLGPNGEKAEWAVHMISGPIPDMGGNWFRHRKLFVPMGEDVVGCNILFSDYKWGWFKVVESHSLGLLIDYAVPQNGRLIKNIRDYVRTTDKPGELLGEFYYDGKRKAFFTLSRIP